MEELAALVALAQDPRVQQHFRQMIDGFQPQPFDAPTVILPPVSFSSHFMLDSTRTWATSVL